MFTKKAKFVHKRVKNAGVPAGTSVLSGRAAMRHTTLFHASLLLFT